jgi:uncharacterized membrane protein YphA (DoxX/SURF4 family)
MGFGKVASVFNRHFRLLAQIACIVTGLLFLAAAVHKVRDPLAFAENIFNYQVLPDALVNPTAIFLPWLEIVAGLAIIFAPRYRRVSAWLLLGLLIFFTGLVGVTMARGIDVACGCFTSDPDATPVGWGKIFENTLWMLVTGFAVWGLHRQPATKSATP